MNVADRIRQTINAQLQPQHVELVNESHMHAGPATDSHFKLIVVAGAFQGQNRVKRHQQIYRILYEEMQSSGKGGTVHALALHLYTPEEWAHATVPGSPLCAGKNNNT